jgi:hypothetical protein
LRAPALCQHLGAVTAPLRADRAPRGPELFRVLRARIADLYCKNRCMYTPGHGHRPPQKCTRRRHQRRRLVPSRAQADAHRPRLPARRRCRAGGRAGCTCAGTGTATDVVPTAPKWPPHQAARAQHLSSSRCQQGNAAQATRPRDVTMHTCETVRGRHTMLLSAQWMHIAQVQRTGCALGSSEESGDGSRRR